MVPPLSFCFFYFVFPLEEKWVTLPHLLFFLFGLFFLADKYSLSKVGGSFLNFLPLSSMTVAADLAATDFLLARWFSRSGCRTVRWSFRWYAQWSSRGLRLVVDPDSGVTGEMVPVLTSLLIELRGTADGWRGWPTARVGAQLWVQIMARLRAWSWTSETRFVAAKSGRLWFDRLGVTSGMLRSDWMGLWGFSDWQLAKFSIGGQVL